MVRDFRTAFVKVVRLKVRGGGGIYGSWFAVIAGNRTRCQTLCQRDPRERRPLVNCIDSWP